MLLQNFITSTEIKGFIVFGKYIMNKLCTVIVEYKIQFNTIS